MATEDNGNGKITMAILGYRMDSSDKKLDEILLKMDKFMDCQNKQENTLTSHGKQLEVDHNEIEKLRESSKNWGIGSGLLGAVATILGAIGLNK